MSAPTQMIRDEQLAVYDRVLPDALFQAVARWAATAPTYPALSARDPSRGAGGAWRQGDGLPQRADPLFHSRRPFPAPLEELAQRVMDLIDADGLVGSFGAAWRDISFRLSRYPAGTRLSWHDDGPKVGAYILWVHERWHPGWGGELMVAQVRSRAEFEADRSLATLSDDAWEERYLMEQGQGRYVAPKPNRLALIAPWTEHAINRVDPEAGDAQRTSISGFLRERPKESDGGVIRLGG